MSIINSVLKIFVGDKNKRDLALLQPIVAKVNAFEKEITNLTNDQLREKTAYFKQIIADDTKQYTSKINKLKEEVVDAN
ncbi:MAG: hypothetical protein Q7U59_05695, partial [Lutibacter sp.]|nr:hypothetical protein [Lutibacter sp.]